MVVVLFVISSLNKLQDLQRGYIDCAFVLIELLSEQQYVSFRAHMVCHCNILSLLTGGANNLKRRWVARFV